jgi:hypothetical protein
MSTFPGSPRVTKGAIVGLDVFNPVASIVVFQYNPDTVTRTVSPQASGDKGDHGDALRLKGPPNETIKLDVEIDAADQPDQPEQPTAKKPPARTSVYPALSSLEMLLYPKSALVVANEVLARFGVIEVIPPEAPLTLLIWGLKRVVPVRLTQLAITEEAFDPELNPIRAKASLDLRVLTYQDLGFFTVGGAISMTHQVTKEVMATLSGYGFVKENVGTGRIE